MTLGDIFNWIFRRKKLESEDFFEAAKSGNLQVIQDEINLKKKFTLKCNQSKLLSKTSALANSTNSFGETPLVLACRSGRLEVVRFLVEDCKADVNKMANILHAEDPQYFLRGLPIHAAVMSGNIDLVKFLIKEHDVDVNVLSESHQAAIYPKKFYMGRNAPLHYAVFCLRGRDRDSMVRFLIEKGADMNIANNAQHFAWITDADNLIHNLQLFIQLGMNVNRQDEFKNTMAHQWARSRDPNALNVIQVLLEVGADFTLKNREGLTPLMVAALEEKTKPFPRIFQRIFNSLSHKMSKEEKMIALELKGSTFITQSDLKEDDAKKICIDFYWENAKKLRLLLEATSDTNNLNLYPKVDSSATTSTNNLNSVKTSMETGSEMKMDIKLEVLKKLQNIIGSNNRFFQNALKVYEEKEGNGFLYDSDLGCLYWPTSQQKVLLVK